MGATCILNGERVNTDVKKLTDEVDLSTKEFQRNFNLALSEIEEAFRLGQMSRDELYELFGFAQGILTAQVAQLEGSELMQERCQNRASAEVK